MSTSPQYEVIGGHFEIDDDLIKGPPRGDISAWGGRGQYELFATGRCALASILLAYSLKFGRNAKILIPEYSCLSTTLQALRFAKCSYDFYAGSTKGINAHELVAKADSQVSHILLVNYFGLFRNDDVAAMIKHVRPDIKVILDCVSDLYFSIDQLVLPLGVDYAFTSHRKFLPVPDGAILRKADCAPEVRCAELENNISSRIFAAGRSKALAHHALDSNAMNERDRYGLMLYQSAIADLAKASPGMSPSRKSNEILIRLDAQAIREKRRENYEFLASELSDIEDITFLKSTLEDSNVPLCIPVLVEGDRRDQLRKYLQSYEIFCPVHWSMPVEFRSMITADTNALYDKQLSLVIDQRYGPRQLVKMVECIHSFMKYL